MVSINIVNDKNEVLPVKGSNWDSIEDAAGDIDGGDFWNEVGEQYPDVKVKEVRIITDAPETPTAQSTFDDGDDDTVMPLDDLDDDEDFEEDDDEEDE